jgi:hypothetical protein
MLPAYHVCQLGASDAPEVSGAITARTCPPHYHRAAVGPWTSGLWRLCENFGGLLLGVELLVPGEKYTL